MKYEYLLFNIIVLIGPICLSFDKRVHYFSRWFLALLASVIVMIPYAIWDAIVTGSHWWFNDKYTLNLHLVGLPVGELLFFITVPFACLFIWEVLAYYLKNKTITQLKFVRIFLFLSMPVGILVFRTGKEYTAIVLVFLGISALVDFLLKTEVFSQSRTYIYLAIVTVLILLFNGYLTARPVVLYDSSYQLDFRIWTVPIEDFGYGYTLILLCTMLFEKLKGGN